MCLAFVIGLCVRGWNNDQSVRFLFVNGSALFILRSSLSAFSYATHFFSILPKRFAFSLLSTCAKRLEIDPLLNSSWLPPGPVFFSVSEVRRRQAFARTPGIATYPIGGPKSRRSRSRDVPNSKSSESTVPTVSGSGSHEAEKSHARAPLRGARSRRVRCCRVREWSGCRAVCARPHQLDRVPAGWARGSAQSIVIPC